MAIRAPDGAKNTSEGVPLNTMLQIGQLAEKIQPLTNTNGIKTRAAYGRHKSFYGNPHKNSSWHYFSILRDVSP